MSKIRKKLALFIFLVLFFLIGSLFITEQIQAAVKYENGVYTYLCGTGSNATADTCNGGCNPYTGSCSAAGNYIVRYSCEGKTGVCLDNEEEFKNFYSVLENDCGKTIAIDVYDKTCRNDNGEWICTIDNLKDRMLFYTGDCQTNDNTNENTNDDNQEPNGTGNPYSALSILLSPTNTASVTPSPTSTPSPSPVPSKSNKIDQNPNPTATPSLALAQEKLCDGIAVKYEDNKTVPTKVTFRIDSNVKDTSKYRIHFGDGQQTESSNNTLTHTYGVSGKFTVKVFLKTKDQDFLSDESCETTVTIKGSDIESHKSACSDLFIMPSNSVNTNEKLDFKIIAYDNKGEIQAYKIQFVKDGEEFESSDNLFEHNYTSPGTYLVKAFIKNSQGEWQEGKSSCQQTIKVADQKLADQPETGVSTLFTIFSLSSGVSGLFLSKKKKSKLS